jgi:transposase-like protein
LRQPAAFAEAEDSEGRECRSNISSLSTQGAARSRRLLFDDWFDAIEDGVRGRVRGFIETMLEEELAGALSRPRYGRLTPGAPPLVVGVRHGHRARTLTGTFGKTRIAVPRARLIGADGKTSEWRARRFAPTSAAPRTPMR